MEYYSAIQKEWSLAVVTTWTDLKGIMKGIMLSKIHQVRQTEKYRMVCLTYP